MAKMYGIFHIYDVDGGFGDAVSCSDLLFVTDSEEAAEAYAQKWSCQHVYDEPYAELERGLLIVREVPFLTDEDASVSPFDFDKDEF